MRISIDEDLTHELCEKIADAFRKVSADIIQQCNHGVDDAVKKIVTYEAGHSEMSRDLENTTLWQKLRQCLEDYLDNRPDETLSAFFRSEWNLQVPRQSEVAAMQHLIHRQKQKISSLEMICVDRERQIEDLLKRAIEFSNSMRNR